MIDIAIRHVGVFTNAQYFEQSPPDCFFLFNLSGLNWMRIPGFFTEESHPFICVILQGETLAFDYGPGREDWVVDFACPFMSSSPDKSEVIIKQGQEPITIPRYVAIPPERAPVLREEFMRMRTFHLESRPESRLLAEIGLLSIVRYMITDRIARQQLSPAWRLRHKIESALDMGDSLTELSAECGYSADHLRMLFRKEFGISPHAYRNRRRMDLAMDLVANTGMTIKEIAYQTGFKHIAHFSAMFKRTFDMTATQAVKKLRSR